MKKVRKSLVYLFGKTPRGKTRSSRNSSVRDVAGMEKVLRVLWGKNFLVMIKRDEMVWGREEMLTPRIRVWYRRRIWSR